MNTFLTSPRTVLTGPAFILIALSLTEAGYSVAPVGDPITWGAATNITPGAMETDVLNTGTLVAAFNLGTTSVAGTTVNGVPFAPFEIPSDNGSGNVIIGNFSIYYSGGRQATNTDLGSSSAPFSSLTSAYKTLLQAGSYASNGFFNLNIQGLTPGQEYVFQWWTNDSAPLLNPYSTSATAGNTVYADSNTSGYVAGGLGQFATGTFTPTGTTQSIQFSGISADNPLINAFQLRAVPEPTSALLLVGSAAMLTLRRRRASV